MSTTTDSQYHSELFRRLDAQARAQGEAHAVLTVLDARGVSVPEAIREQILACTDLAQLETWLRRHCGAALTGRLWKPLLNSRFENNPAGLPATYLWARTRRMSGAERIASTP